MLIKAEHEEKEMQLIRWFQENDGIGCHLNKLPQQIQDFKFNLVEIENPVIRWDCMTDFKYFKINMFSRLKKDKYILHAKPIEIRELLQETTGAFLILSKLEGWELYVKSIYKIYIIKEN